MKKTFLVVGATGSVGSGIVEALVAQGHAVRATTSRREKVGRDGAVETVLLDLASGEGTHAAFEGVDRAFLLAPPGYADQHRLLSPLVAEAARRRLEKVVLMTAMGADAADTPFRRVEQELEGSGLRYHIVRPNWFMQNFNTFWLQGINEHGKILLPAGGAKVSFIDARDIAAVAARLLAADDISDGAYVITGPEALDHDQVASILSAETARKITYEEVDPDVLRKGLLEAGVPADYAEFLLVILGFLAQGYAERQTRSVRELLGREPIRFEQYARDHRAAWNPTRKAA